MRIGDFKFVVNSEREVKPLEEKLDALLKCIIIRSNGPLLVRPDNSVKHWDTVHISPLDPNSNISCVESKKDMIGSFYLETTPSEIKLRKDSTIYRIHYK